MSTTAELHPARVFSWVNTSSTVTVFFQIGLMFMLLEAFYQEEYHSLAFTPFTTRSIVGIHLWPTQIWFKFVGNALALAILFRNRFRLPALTLKNTALMFGVLGVYLVWFFYGMAVGNWGAPDLFREMLYPAVMLPGAMYLARFVDVRQLFVPLIYALAIFIPIFAINAFILKMIPLAPNVYPVLMFIGTLATAYFLFRSLTSVVWLLCVLGISLGAILVLNKPQLALIAGYLLIVPFVTLSLTPSKVPWSINRNTVKFSILAMISVAILFISILLLDRLLDGRLTAAFLTKFVKVVVTDSGELMQGDVTGGRGIIWTNAIKSWKESPIIGNGLGTPVFHPQNDIAQLHNYPLQALNDTGLLGFGILAICWFFWFKGVIGRLRQIPWNHTKLVYASLLSFVLGCFFYGIYGLPMIEMTVAQLFWLSIAFLSSFDPSNKLVNGTPSLNEPSQTT